MTEPTRKPGPTPAFLIRGGRTQDEADQWFRQNCGNIPAPAPYMDAPRPVSAAAQDATAALERSIPELYRWARFGAPELAERTGGVAAKVLADGKWRKPKLVLLGVTGSGKTSLAVACLRQWARETGKTAKFTSARAIARARLPHAAAHGEVEAVDRALRAPMLLLDGLGSERESAASAISDVIEDRHDLALPIWITTGLTRAQLAARYGEGTMRRIFEGATLLALRGAE